MSDSSDVEVTLNILTVGGGPTRLLCLFHIVLKNYTGESVTVKGITDVTVQLSGQTESCHCRERILSITTETSVAGENHTGLTGHQFVQ